MRTTLELSNHLIQELMAVEKWDSKTQAIEAAIEDFVRRRRLDNLISARGRLKVKDVSAELRKLETHGR
ncbi:MAG TPA: type II toxin-antitoxin system VapB family antitoxin [bacterium]|nr:type II toxin-antitoxin system VapB family antitoxin [bacterium]